MAREEFNESSDLSNRDFGMCQRLQLDLCGAGVKLGGKSIKQLCSYKHFRNFIEV